MSLRAPGHSIVLIRQRQPGGECLITLECTCEAVLARGLFVVDDAVNQGTIRSQGHDEAKAHLAEVVLKSGKTGKRES